MKILGIDEAGRGALVGPLVIGGYMADEKDVPFLKSIGVKDSKLLTPKKRAEIYKQLKERGKCITIKVSPEEIDMMNKAGVNLNMLEIRKMIKIIQEMAPDKAFIDSPSRNEKKVREIISSQVRCEVISECKADLHYPIVGAGSILAKHERDMEIKNLEKELNAVIGAGYPSDERTIEFARKALHNKGWLTHVRHSWETFSRIAKESEQQTLGDFND